MTFIIRRGHDASSLEMRTFLFRRVLTASAPLPSTATTPFFAPATSPAPTYSRARWITRQTCRGVPFAKGKWYQNVYLSRPLSRPLSPFRLSPHRVSQQCLSDNMQLYKVEAGAAVVDKQATPAKKRPARAAPRTKGSKHGFKPTAVRSRRRPPLKPAGSKRTTEVSLPPEPVSAPPPPLIALQPSPLSPGRHVIDTSPIPSYCSDECLLKDVLRTLSIRAISEAHLRRYVHLAQVWPGYFDCQLTTGHTGSYRSLVSNRLPQVLACLARLPSRCHIPTTFRQPMPHLHPSTTFPPAPHVHLYYLIFLLSLLDVNWPKSIRWAS